MNHSVELGGGGKLENVSRITKHRFWYEKALLIFNKDAKEAYNSKNSLHEVVWMGP